MLNLLFIVLSFAFGSEWTQEKLNLGGIANVQMVTFFSPQEMFIRAYHGGYRNFYSTDGGKSAKAEAYFGQQWPSVVSVGGSLLVSYGGILASWEEGKPTPIMNLQVNFHGSSNGYAIGEYNGTLIMNRNANETDRWELISTGTRIYSIAIAQNGKVLLSGDKGTFLMDAEDKKPTLLNTIPNGVFVFASGEHFLGLHGGVIYQLKDKTWERTEVAGFVQQNMPHIERAGIFRHTQPNKFSWVKVDDQGKVVLEELPIPPNFIPVGAYTAGGQPTIVLNNGTILYRQKLASLKINFIGEGTVKVKTSKGPQGTSLRIRKADELSQDFYVGQSIELEGTEKSGFKFAGWQIKGKKELNTNTKLTVTLPKEVYEITAQFEKK